MKPYLIIEWTRNEGEVRAIDRLRVTVLPLLIQEGVPGLGAVTAATEVSNECYGALKTAAGEIVGRPCPV